MDYNLREPLIISILAHLCLILIILLSPAPKPAPALQPIQVVYQNETDNKRSQQIVSNVSPPTKELVNELKKRVNLLSQLTRRVLHQEVARRSGVKTVNRSASREQNSNSFDSGGPSPSITAPMGTIPDSDFNNSHSNNSNGLHSNQLLGESTILDDIPEVRAGGFTALNTNQFIFYTFYSRINEQIGNRWVENIQNILYRTPNYILKEWANKDQVTQVEILLTPQGKFVKAIIFHHADNRVIDDAAVSAFRRAAPFTNPPSGLVSRDGYIHLLYSFHVYFRPRFLASDGSQ